MVTNVPMLALGITTADCGPVLFADADAGVIGAAHAGWRGALAGVIEATIAAMERLGAVRARVVAALGPTIRQENYEVGKDLVDRFLAADPGNARFFAEGQRAGHAQFDLPGFIMSRLERAGIAAAHDIACCTYADADRFYSYRRTTHRREADYGRHINAIVLAPQERGA
jgi:YfiH family protein